MDAAALEAAGWTQIPGNAFVTHVGPFWRRGDGAEFEVAFVGRPEHANHIGTVNGGMLATFADVALGYAAVRSLGGAHTATVQLQMHYTATAQIGELVTCTPEVVRKTSQLVFTRGMMMAGDNVVAAADGIWKVLTPRA